MKIKKKGWVAIEHIQETECAAQNAAYDCNLDGGVVEVEYDTDAPELSSLEAAAVNARGGRVQRITYADGTPARNGDQFEESPDNAGNIFLFAKARYVEVPQ